MDLELDQIAHHVIIPAETSVTCRVSRLLDLGKSQVVGIGEVVALRKHLGGGLSGCTGRNSYFADVLDVIYGLFTGR